jgi:hypothetical protein
MPPDRKEVSMSEAEDLAYFRARAAQERELARSSRDPLIAGIHTQMAECYDDLVKRPRKRRALQNVAEAKEEHLTVLSPSAPL